MAKSFRDRCARLASMSGGELLDRVKQKASARVDVLRYRMGHKFAVAMQASGAHPHARFFFDPNDVLEICELLKRRLPEEADAIVRWAEKICQHRFDLLGYQDLDYGKKIDWHCDRLHGKSAPRKPFHLIHYLDFAEAGDVKVTWELNRHQHFIVLAKAYRLTGNEKFAVELFQQWRHWHAENVYPIGINWASTLEVAFRSLAWLWMYFVLGDCPVAPPGFREEWIHALGISGRHIELYLSTYFSPNTHLLGEAVALFFIGTMCPELQPSQSWKKRAWEIVVREADRQVGADGLHFEQSTYYHVYALDFFLHARILASRNGVSIPKQFDDTLRNMLSAISLLSRAGLPPRLGDDDGGRLFNPLRNRSEHMLDPFATGAALYHLSDLKTLAGGIREETLWLLGLAGVAEFDGLAQVPSNGVSTVLENAGVYVMGGTNRQLVIDCGPQGPATAGHGHADALSICLNSSGHTLLIDPGTCQYIGKGGDRGKFRGTPAHSTLTVDDYDQADSKGPFAWTNLPVVRPTQWINGEGFDLFVGSHNGYSRFASPVTHRRTVFSLKDKFWLVRDEAEGTGEHKLDLYWHLSPNLIQKDKIQSIFASCDRSEEFVVLPALAHGWTSEVEQGWWSPAYGRKEAAPLLHFSTTAALPAEFVTLMVTRAVGGAVNELLQCPVTGSVRQYRYRTANEEYCISFALCGRWIGGAWSSDAEFLCWGTSNGNRQLIMCNGSYVAYGDEKVVSCEHRVKSCEIYMMQGKTRIISTETESIVLHRSLDSIPADDEVVANASGRGSSRTDA
ncbi:MAG: heparinase II/III family protein [Acidobacteriota bacterium]|nr:heparinase II/III family protein [Acidobacteriota bacterium]